MATLVRSMASEVWREIDRMAFGLINPYTIITNVDHGDNSSSEVGCDRAAKTSYKRDMCMVNLFWEDHENETNLFC